MAFTWHSQCPLKPGTGFCIHGPNLILSRSLWNPCAVRRENETVENKQGLAWALLIFGAAFYLSVDKLFRSNHRMLQPRIAEAAHTNSTACQKTSCLLFSCPCYPVPAPATAHITKIQHNHSYWLPSHMLRHLPRWLPENDTSVTPTGDVQHGATLITAASPDSTLSISYTILDF